MSGLTALIREVADDHPLADPRELARLVAKLTPDDELVEFYTEALVDSVRHILAGIRTTALAGPCQARPPRSGHDNTSAKVKQRQSWWDEVLATRVHVGHAQWKRLADCTANDLTFCIAEREKLVRQINGQIVNYERLIALLAKHEKETVADLPPQSSWDAAS